MGALFCWVWLIICRVRLGRSLKVSMSSFGSHSPSTVCPCSASSFTIQPSFSAFYLITRTIQFEKDTAIKNSVPQNATSTLMPYPLYCTMMKTLRPMVMASQNPPHTISRRLMRRGTVPQLCTWEWKSCLSSLLLNGLGLLKPARLCHFHSCRRMQFSFFHQTCLSLALAVLKGYKLFQ